MTRVTPERLVRLLTAPAVEWRKLVDLEPAAFCQLCDEHGITALIAERLAAHDMGLGAHDREPSGPDGPFERKADLQDQ